MKILDEVRILKLMNEVKKDNPERFSQPVDKFLTYIK